ncbi:hypothetical protein F4819DRAFT_71759 [Hypoxylon fuscum]|nr:hypothetical protein F4819DRAFT_71759 [Hypoxylon fuscum]
MEQMTDRVHATKVERTHFPLNSKTHPEVAIYNEDDLSHLLYVNHLHYDGHKNKVIVNHVYRDGYSTPLESISSGIQTPASESNETPVLSDCESDSDEGAFSSPSTHSRRNSLRFEDGFEFPVFLGRQADESQWHETTQPASKPSTDINSQDKHVRVAASEEHHVPEITGPLMSWWPEPLELMEHEWVQEDVAESKAPATMSVHHHVSNIEGPLMSWWPVPMEMMEHEWDERFYE